MYSLDSYRKVEMTVEPLYSHPRTELTRRTKNPGRCRKVAIIIFVVEKSYRYIAMYSINPKLFPFIFHSNAIKIDAYLLYFGSRVP